jgi:hypothetical protein
MYQEVDDDTKETVRKCLSCGRLSKDSVNLFRSETDVNILWQRFESYAQRK